MRKTSDYSFRELRLVGIVCPHCATRVVLDMDSYEPAIPPRRERPAFAPRLCPTCQAPFDAVAAGLEDLHRAYRQLAKQGMIRFLVESPDEG